MATTGAERARLAAKRASLQRLAELAAPQDDYQWMVLRGIGRQRRPETLELLAAHLQADNPQVRAAAVLAVAEADPQRAAELLRPLAHDASDHVVEAVAGALITTATPDDLPTLTALARHHSSEVRQHAAEALGAIAHPQAVPALAGLLDDPAFLVRFDARAALRGSGLAAAADALASNPRRGPLRRWRDVRAARRRAHRRSNPPRWLVTSADRQLAMAAWCAIEAAAIIALAVALADASPVIALVALVMAAVIGLLAALGTSSERALGLAEHDRARARARPAPPDRVVIGKLAAAVRIILSPPQLARAAAWAAVVLALEVLLPTAGLIAAAGASPLLVVAAALLGSRRRILATGVTTLTSIDAQGRTGIEVWLAPTAIPAPDVRATAV